MLAQSLGGGGGNGGFTVSGNIAGAGKGAAAVSVGVGGSGGGGGQAGKVDNIVIGNVSSGILDINGNVVGERALLGSLLSR